MLNSHSIPGAGTSSRNLLELKLSKSESVLSFNIVFYLAEISDLALFSWVKPNFFALSFSVAKTFSPDNCLSS
jgi:hypothetical protein